MAHKQLYITRGRRRKSIPRGAVLIYDEIEEIRASKGRRSNFPNDKFKHKFKTRGTKIYGLPDGSLLVIGPKPLWDMFEYN
jgi:hypothetical protein